jgi:hypothetical protein
MNDEESLLFEIKPIAMCVDRGTVMMQEFMSRDGRVIAGYRARPGVVRFPAWMRLSDMVTGFRETDRQWFLTVETARAWVLARVGSKQESSPASAVVSSSARQRTEAA